jgi:hypothetical protein
MSKVTQIETKLKAIDGGRFQTLCDFYLRQHPRYINLQSIGSAIGKDKTTTGIPDSIITLPDGTLALAHYTTKESGLSGKLRADYESSFNEAKTGIPVDQIKEIIFCHNGNCRDELSLVKLGQERGVIVTIFGLKQIAYDLFDKYRGLAREFLYVEVDSGQIVSPEEFVSDYGKNSLSTPLDTAFHFREEELQELLTALESNDLVLISGPAGVGKSRLMLEAGGRFKLAHEGWTVKSIINRGVDIFQDLKVYLQRPGKYVLLVDDANRLDDRLNYILQLLHEQTEEVRIKIIATVRDYAREKVRSKAAPYGGGYEVKLQPFSDDQIRTLVSDEANINDYFFLKRIVDIARGNPRLAMMAAKVATEKQTFESIVDVSSLYDEYFGSVLENLKDLDEEMALKVAGIVSFFRAIDCSDQGLMGAVSGAFAIAPSDFRHTVKQLNRLELVDLHENEVAKISDQVLGSYLFYTAALKSEILSFSTLLDHFFPRHHSLFIDALHPVLNSLGARIENKLRPHIDRKWKALEDEQRHEDLISLMQAFWFVKETDTLRYIRETVRHLPTEEVEIDSLDFCKEIDARSNPLLDLLGVFNSSSHSRTALELVLEAFSRDPRYLGNVLRMLKNDFGFKPDSSFLEFTHQREVIDLLWTRTEDGKSLLYSKLFLSIATHYLHTHFETTERKSRWSISLTPFSLFSTPTLHMLRQIIWDHVFALYSAPELQRDVLDLLHDYSHAGYQVEDISIVAQDAQQVIPFMLATLEPGNFKHISIVRRYLAKLDYVGVVYELNIRDKFTNQLSRLADMLLINDIPPGKSFLEEEEQREEELRIYVEDFTAEDYKQLLFQCLKMRNDTPDAKWSFQRGIGKLFSILKEKGSELYTPVVVAYLEMGSPFGLNGREVAEALIQSMNVDLAYSIINGSDYPDKPKWIFDFFARIPASEVTSVHLDQLYNLYSETPVSSMPVDLQFLERYIPLDERVVVRVVETLLSRMELEKDSGFALRLSSLFNPYATPPENLLSYFGTEHEWLKRAYLAALEAQNHFDYDGRGLNLILDIDHRFLHENINFLVDKAKRSERYWLNSLDDSRDFSFLWRRKDYESLVSEALERLFELRQGEGFHSEHYLEVLFGTAARGKKMPSELVKRQAELIGRLIVERATDADFMEFVFQAVRSLPGDDRRELIAIFLQNNKRFEDFNRLRLESMSGAWSGSAVPFFQKKLDFAESLLPLVQCLDLLEHRSQVEKWIETLQRRIEKEKRDDFVDI